MSLTLVVKIKSRHTKSPTGTASVGDDPEEKQGWAMAHRGTIAYQSPGAEGITVRCSRKHSIPGDGRLRLKLYAIRRNWSLLRD